MRRACFSVLTIASFGLVASAERSSGDAGAGAFGRLRFGWPRAASPAPLARSASPARARPVAAALVLPSLDALLGRGKRLLKPVHAVRLEGMSEQPSGQELVQMARDAGLIGLEREPAEAKLLELLTRVQAWYAARGYLAVGASSLVEPEGVLRVRMRIAPAAAEPTVLSFVDSRGEPARKTGKTRATVVSSALGLKAGQPIRLSGRALRALVGPDGPFVGVGTPAVRLTPSGSAQLVLAVCEGNSSEVAPTVGIRGSEWYASLSAKDGNLRGRNQRLGVELSKHNASSASLSFDDPRLGRPLGWGADAWVENVAPPELLLKRIPVLRPALRSIGGQLPLFGGGEDEDEEEQQPQQQQQPGADPPAPLRRIAKRAQLARAGLTVRCDALRSARWKLRLVGTVEKVALAKDGASALLGPPAQLGKPGVVAGGERPAALAEATVEAAAARELELDLPVSLCLSLTSQQSAAVQQRLSLTRTLPLHPRCPDFALFEYRLRARARTRWARVSVRGSAELSAASAGQPEYLSRSLGGGGTVRGMSQGALGLARSLACARAEVRVQVGGRPGESLLFVTAFTDGACGLVLAEGAGRAQDEPQAQAQLQLLPPQPQTRAGWGRARPGSGPAQAPVDALAVTAASISAPRATRPAAGGCVGVGLLVGPIRFEYTLASTREVRKTIGLDFD